MSTVYCTIVCTGYWLLYYISYIYRAINTFDGYMQNKGNNKITELRKPMNNRPSALDTKLMGVYMIYSTLMWARKSISSKVR